MMTNWLKLGMCNDILLRLLRVYIATLRICKKCHILSKKNDGLISHECLFRCWWCW